MASKYKQQFLELMSYVADIQDKNLNAKRETPIEFKDSKQRKILTTAINKRQQNKLQSCGWRLSQNGWKETLDKLDSLQMLIHQEMTQKQQISWLIKNNN